ncbi:hypothetical protein [Psychrobacillus sp. FSL H8-0510]|uniref:hypothetical protein n=2 Tax=unclassified Psychrobacillus TaxID=2636677 RepID=UPI0030F86EFD
MNAFKLINNIGKIAFNIYGLFAMINKRIFHKIKGRTPFFKALLMCLRKGVRPFFGFEHKEFNTLMKINLIYNQKSLVSTWEDILSLLYPNAIQSCFPITDWNKQTNQEDVDLVFYISMNVTDSFKKISDYYYKLNIPILCVMEHYTEVEYKVLRNSKLKGLIHMRTTSVKSIKEITDLILDGGYYLEPPIKS